MAKPKSNLKTASVLAFERKLEPSDAMMSAGSWEQRFQPDSYEPIQVHEKSVRGTISNRLKSKDQEPGKLEASIQQPNLQTVDVATLPHDSDTLLVRFSLRILPGVGQPSACNSAAYSERLREVIQGYVANVGFKALSQRYAANLANGRFLWRNRIGVEAVETRISRMKDGEASQSWTFNSLGLSLSDFEDASIDELAKLVEAGLSGEEPYILLDVQAYARLGSGQEVYPSQELILDRGSSGKSRTLYSVNGQAGIHSQKIGNALRTIDTWYPKDDDTTTVRPIAIEPYGSVTTEGRAYRQPKAKVDFYNLLDSWVLKDQAPAVEQQHYVIGVLIRGGVFGDTDK